MMRCWLHGLVRALWPLGCPECLADDDDDD